MRKLFVLVVALSTGFIPPRILAGDPARMLMPFLGLFMAGIFPAISLTIGAMKSGGFSVQRINNLASGLRNLLDQLQSMFLVALISAITLVTAQTLDWGKNFPKEIYSSHIFNFILGSCFSYLAISLPMARSAFYSLLNISKDIAVDEASNKIKDQASKIPSVVDRFPTKEKFGELFQVKDS